MPKIDPELRAEFKEIVEEVVQAELEAFMLSLTHLLTPLVEATKEIDRSCRLLIQGQALVEKCIADQQDDREPWQDADDEAE